MTGRKGAAMTTDRRGFIAAGAACTAATFMPGLLAARRAYIRSLGIPDQSVVQLEYLDYARSKYLALGMKDTMPAK